MIWIGSGLGWGWVRDRLFRLAHLFAIGLVSTLSLLGIACPLTALEDWLRNGSVGAQGFIERWVNRSSITICRPGCSLSHMWCSL
jgi:Protein of Unknown function (DUF2784)